MEINVLHAPLDNFGMLQSKIAHLAGEDRFIIKPSMFVNARRTSIGTKFNVFNVIYLNILTQLNCNV